ncbi:MAG: transposase, partial [bacterium]
MSNGQGVPAVARALGISEALLYQWRHRSKGSVENPANEQVDTLRKQVK